MEINSNQQPHSNANPNAGGLGNAQRPGEHLRQLRLAQKRELADVARELSMAERQVIALESDDYKALPEPAFIKGYFRSYARLLGTDATPLIARFNEIYTSDTGLPNNHALENSPLKTLGRLQRGRKPRIKWVKWLMILLALAALIFALVAGVRMLKNKPSNTAVDTDEVAVESVSATPTVVELPSAAAHQRDQLSLSFSRPATVLIKDATGKTLASGRQDAALTLDGDSPFEIRLDDPKAVQLKLNGEEIGLATYTQSSGKAEFRLSR